MQTAEQNNLPQTGMVEVDPSSQNPSFPPTNTRKTEASSAVPSGDIQKSWSLRQVRDTRDAVIEAIQGAATAPDEAKVFLEASINRTHPNSRLIEVDAHCQVVQLPDGKVKHFFSFAISDL